MLLALGGDRVLKLVGAESLHAAKLGAAITALGHGCLLGDIEDVEPAQHDLTVRDSAIRVQVKKYGVLTEERNTQRGRGKDISQ